MAEAKAPRPELSSQAWQQREEILQRFEEDLLRQTKSLFRPEQAPAPAAAPAWPAVPGYEVLGLLGRGGMGVVYRARHRGLNRVVALKMILAGSHADPEEVRRFLAEAEAVTVASYDKT